jgi:hypothetical protein
MLARKLGVCALFCSVVCAGNVASGVEVRAGNLFFPENVHSVINPQNQGSVIELIQMTTIYQIMNSSGALAQDMPIFQHFGKLMKIMNQPIA